MDYGCHYDRLINRAIGRAIDLVGYSERHHIIPECVGGPDEARNIVRLTPEEHYVAHLLLVKMLPHHRGLIFAAKQMTIGSGKQTGRACNKLYGWLRRRFTQKMIEIHTGSKRSIEARANMSAARIGMKMPPFSNAHKARLSKASKGRAKSDEHRAAMASAQKQRYADPVERARQAEHLKTARPLPKIGASGFRGVEWSVPTKKWRARGCVNRKSIHIGLFDTPEEAHAAYLKFAASKQEA